MSTPTDRERLAHFVQLIGAEPRQAEFDEAGNLIMLNLAGLGLRELPPAIGELSRLEVVILGQSYDNQEKDSQLWTRNELGNALIVLPNEITRLNYLRTLICENNQLRSLPPDFAKLLNLQTLYLEDNQLSDLPPDFGKLINLKTIRLHNNQLNSLPPDFAKLTNLQYLTLHNNQLSILPPDFAKLTNLQYIKLNHNKLSILPPDFAKLIKLETLGLYKNELNSLPTDFAKLVNLQMLGLGKNRLNSLPQGFAHLISLQKLYLDNNQLNSLPSDFARLVNLKELNLGNNQLSSLPPEFTKLINLQILNLTGNSWRTPPPEIAEAGVGEVMNFLRSLQTDNVITRYQAKLLIIGEGGTGKSSVLRSLRGLVFDEGLTTTHGIDIQVYRRPYPQRAGITMTLNIWDFGGQQIYHTTHQFFMTRRSLYLLVWNARGIRTRGGSITGCATFRS